MEEVLKFLKESGTFYLATVEGDQPRVRPFGAVCGFEGKIYLVTNNQKKCYAQMMENPKVEISGMVGGNWIRVEAKAIRDDRREARAAMLEDNPGLRRMYNEDDGLVEVLYLKDVTATISSFTDAPVVYQF